MVDVELLSGYRDFLRSWRYQLEELEGEVDGWDGLSDEMVVARVIDRVVRMEEFGKRMRVGVLSQIRGSDSGLFKRGFMLARRNAGLFRKEFEEIARRVAERMGWKVKG